MKLFDSHCHLDDDRSYGKDRPEVLKRAEQAGVAAVMIVGVDEASARKAVRLTEEYRNCFAAVGLHPHDAKNCSEETLLRLKRLADNPGVRRSADGTLTAHSDPRRGGRAMGY